MENSLSVQISESIVECGRILKKGNQNEAKELSSLLIKNYANKIRDITYGLSEYSYLRSTDYIEDIGILMEKLKSLKECIEMSASNRKANDELFSKIKNDISYNRLLSTFEISETLSKISSIKAICDSELPVDEKWVELRDTINWIGTKDVVTGLKLMHLIQHSIGLPVY